MFKIIPVAILLFLTSCASKKEPEKESISILPYKDMLLSELKQIEETPLAIYQYNYTAEGTLKDSAILDRAAFKALANNFTDPDIADPKVKNNYIENSFEDVVNNSYNFSYATTNEKMPVKNIILTFHKGDQSRLKSLQISKAYQKNGQKIMQQLFWKTKSYFTISTIKDSSKTETTGFTKVVWGI